MSDKKKSKNLIIIILLGCILLLGIFFVLARYTDNIGALLDFSKTKESSEVSPKFHESEKSENSQENGRWLVSEKKEYGMTIQYEYNEYGECVKELWVSDSGDSSRDSSYEYIYNADGDCIKCIHENLQQGRVTEEYSYLYDDKGNCVTKTETKIDGEKYVRDYTYDQNGNMIEEIYTYVDGEIVQEMTGVVYEYNSQGQCVKEVSHQYRSMVVEEHTYDEEGKRVKTTGSYDGTDVSEYEVKYIYDDNGNCIREERSDVTWYSPNMDDIGKVDNASSTSVTEYKYELVHVKQRKSDLE